MTWIFSQAELYDSPSRRDGVSEILEKEYRYKTCSFIFLASNNLSLPITIASTACVLFHRFFTKHSFKDHDRMIVAQTCIFLGAKIEEAPTKLQEVILKSYEVIWKKVHPNTIFKPLSLDSSDFYDTRDRILMTERILLYTMSFDLSIEHPYNHLIKSIDGYILFDLDSNPKSEISVSQIKQTAWTFINDSIRTDACLRFSSRTIACAAIVLAGKYWNNNNFTFHEVSSHCSGNQENLSKLMNVDNAHVTDAMNTLLDLYEYSKFKETHLH